MEEPEHEELCEVGPPPITRMPPSGVRGRTKKFLLLVGPAAVVIVVLALIYAIDAMRGSAHGRALPPPGHGTGTASASASASVSASAAPSGTAASGPATPTPGQGGGGSPVATPSAPSGTGGSGGSGGSSGGSGGIGGPVPTTPPVTSPPPTSGPRVEEAYNRHGVPTFADPTKVRGQGPAIAFQANVLVSCKLYDPSIPSVIPSGYWYRIQSAPWNGDYYAAANTFLNGDPPGGPYTHTVDDSLPPC